MVYIPYSDRSCQADDIYRFRKCKLMQVNWKYIIDISAVSVECLSYRCDEAIDSVSWKTFTIVGRAY